MAKISVVERGKRRVKAYEKHKEARQKLKAIIYNVEATLDEKQDAQLKLQKLPRDSMVIRQRNRCRLCGRPRAFNRLTGLCRMHLRSALMKGFIPGMHKSSW
ncbi:MAG TPA: 30S ribosomal protein S14 [Gammaproteobacteria bacterium]|nr:30S ribosomal protein S14 [Gammaproteobacteria bacterium]